MRTKDRLRPISNLRIQESTFMRGIIHKILNFQNTGLASSTIATMLFFLIISFPNPAWSQIDLLLNWPGKPLSPTSSGLLENSIKASCPESLQLVNEFNMGIEKEFGKDSPEAAAARIRQVYFLNKCGDSKGAISLGNSVIADSKNILNKYPKESFLLNKLMSNIFRDQKNFQMSAKFLSEALGDISKSPDLADRSGDTYADLGDDYFEGENFVKARESYIEAMRIMESGDRKKRFLALRNVKYSLAETYRKLEDYNNAINLFEECVSMTEIMGLSTESSKNELADAYFQLYQKESDDNSRIEILKKLENLYIELIDMSKSKPEALIYSTLHLSSTYFLLGINANNQTLRNDYYEKSISLCLKILQNEEISSYFEALVIARQMLSIAYYGKQDYKNCGDQLLEIVKLNEDKYSDPYNYETLHSKLELLFYYRVTIKDQAKAKNLFSELSALTARLADENEQKLGPNAGQTYTAKACQALLYAANGDYEKSKPLLSKLLRDSEQKFGSADNATIYISNNVVLANDYESIEENYEVMEAAARISSFLGALNDMSKE
jgi:hypothetical protein